jgi:dipeptidyl aminopeptidase/acylaminoacyl peptidase
MTSKVIEANSGIFAAGLAVAPVTDWRFYGMMKQCMRISCAKYKL